MNAPIKNEIVCMRKIIDRTTINLRLDKFSKIVPGIVIKFVQRLFVSNNVVIEYTWQQRRSTRDLDYRVEPTHESRLHVRFFFFIVDQKIWTKPQFNSNDYFVFIWRIELIKTIEKLML